MPTLNQFLTYSHISKGLTLDETEDLLTLHCGSEVIAIYGLYVDPENIVKDADEWLNKNKGGI